MTEGLGTARSGPSQRRGFREPRVSVLVAARRSGQLLRECLDSLAAQTLPPADFEILVLHGDLGDSTLGVLADFSAAHPAHRARLIGARGSEPAHLRNIGLESARGEHVTFVEGDGRVSAPFLESLLRAWAPGVVPMARIEDVAAASEAVVEPDPDLHGSSAPGPVTARLGDPDELVTCLSSSVATLIRTAEARAVRYDASLRIGMEQVYSLELMSRRHLRFRLLDADAGAIHLRTSRPAESSSGAASYDSSVTHRLELLAAIEAVDRSQPEVAGAARGLVLEQAAQLNAYLRDHPDDHARVVDDARSLGLREVPWRSVNAGLARDLAICYCFPPDLDTSGMVAARRLRERGLVVDVISKNLSAVRTVDPDSLRVPAEILDRTHVVRGAASFVRWSAVTAFAGQSWSTMEHWEATQGRYRSLYSRAMAPGSHFAAALVKLRRPEVSWVAEFSDPLRFNPLGQERVGGVEDDWLSRELCAGLTTAGFELPAELRVFDLAERVAYALADQIIFTNRNQMAYMLGYCLDPGLVERVRAISEVRHHPTLPADFYDLDRAELVLDAAQVHVAYFGVFYSTRGLGEVLEAFSRLSQRERDRIRLHVFTPDPDRLALDVVRAGLAGVVVVRPFVGFLKFLHLTTTFDVLLVNDASTGTHSGVNPYLPSKVSDYRGSGTPIWAVYEQGSVMSAMSFSHRSPVGDVDAALGVLRHLIAREPARGPARVAGGSGA